MTLSSFSYSTQKDSESEEEKSRKKRSNENARDSIKLWKKKKTENKNVVLINIQKRIYIVKNVYIFYDFPCKMKILRIHHSYFRIIKICLIKWIKFILKFGCYLFLVSRFIPHWFRLKKLIYIRRACLLNS